MRLWTKLHSAFKQSGNRDKRTNKRKNRNKFRKKSKTKERKENLTFHMNVTVNVNPTLLMKLNKKKILKNQNS